jgi:hypothetical protein
MAPVPDPTKMVNICRQKLDADLTRRQFGGALRVEQV